MSHDSTLWSMLAHYEVFVLNRMRRKENGIEPDTIRVMNVLRWLTQGKTSRAFRPYYLDYLLFFCRSTLANALRQLLEFGYLETYNATNDLRKGEYRWTDAGEKYLRAFWTAFDRRMDRYRGRMNGYEMQPYKRKRIKATGSTPGNISL